MKKVAFFMVFLLVMSGAIYGALYLDKISAPPHFEATPMSLAKIDEQPITQDESWVASLSNKNASELPFAYPATELSVRFDFVDKPTSSIPSAISINDLDEYKFACVKQVLRQNKIESAYYKSGDMLKLMVFLEDEATYKKLLADLNYYRLSYTIQ